MNASHLRSKWAAVGAAVAVTLGAGGIGITQATTSSGEQPIYIPIAPCRLADTRPAFLVGPRATPLGAEETYTLSGWGAVGGCTLPTGTTGLALNVTALNATTGTFLALYPAGVAVPNASSLNPAPGQPPTPNGVIVDLNAAGSFSIFNKAGSVDFIIDVVGYYDDHEHNGSDIIDESLTGTDIQNNSVGSVDTQNEPGVAFDFQDAAVNGSTEAAAVTGTSIRVPSDGYVSIEVTGLWRGLTAGAPPGNEDDVDCQLQKGAVTAIDLAQPNFRLDDLQTADLSFRAFSAHRMMPIAAGDNPALIFAGQAINLVCDEDSGNVAFDEIQISATFFASSYRPIGFVIPLPLVNEGEEPAVESGPEE